MSILTETLLRIQKVICFKRIYEFWLQCAVGGWWLRDCEGEKFDEYESISKGNANDSRTITDRKLNRDNYF